MKGNSEKGGYKQEARNGENVMRSEKEQVGGSTTLYEMATEFRV